MANFAVETLDTKSIVILAEDDPFLADFRESFESVFRQYGGEVEGIIDFSSDSDDLAAVVDQALALEPGGVYLAASGRNAAKLVRLLRAAGFGRKEDVQEWIMTTSAFAHPNFIREAGSDADGVYVTQTVFDLSNEEGPMPTFVASFREKFRSEPDVYAGHGYDALLLFGGALKGTQTTLSSDFMKALRAMDPLAGVTGHLQFNDEGDVQKFPRIHWIESGRTRDFQKAMEERREAMRERLRQIEEEARRLRNEALR